MTEKTIRITAPNGTFVEHRTNQSLALGDVFRLIGSTTKFKATSIRETAAGQVVAGRGLDKPQLFTQARTVDTMDPFPLLTEAA